MFDDEVETTATAYGTLLPFPKGRDTMRDLISGMATAFNPDAAGDLEAVIQFKVTGHDPGNYCLDVAESKCMAYEGDYPTPKMTINTPSDVWMAISSGELDGAGALMGGKYTVEGDFSLLMRFSEVFSAR